ncbi:photosynthetic reaction center cytochrome PufC [Fulvimarina sp. MAC8]|uniref:photosynthetic reaction center cytochrome PufC n=1 Tax=Fulvimarina sp. MAC8 TaxID=3162874 RepID=UPI0032ED260C
MSNERKKRIAPRYRVAPIITGVFSLALGLILLTVPPWVIPPIEATETGPAAIEMVQFKDGDRQPDYLLPEAPPPAEPYEGELKASEAYENVVVLGDLSEGEFTRLMLAITEWVAPEQGCEYCHNVEEGFASDSVYQKTVARMMLQMTRNINTNWPEHVAPAGVTCYTCHRGENVPSQSWYEQEEPGGNQFLGKPRPWYLEAKTIRQFFPAVPYAAYLSEDPAPANIQSQDPLVSDTGDAEVAREQTAENLYLFMMQQSNALGVNCTYCHNSRAFADWSQSTPFRWIGYWGIRMAREINVSYIEPLQGIFPPERLGPLGDPAKVHCGTCHRGEPQPLQGYELMHSFTAGLSENGEVPDPGPKEAILLGEAMPVAQTGPDTDAQAQPEPAPVNETAVERSVAPEAEGQDSEGQSGEGVRYESQQEPNEEGGSQAVEETTEQLPAETSGEGSSEAEEPTGADAPSGSDPQQLNPDTSMQESGSTNDAPSAGDPGTGTSSEGEGETAPGKSGSDAGTATPPENEGSTETGAAESSSSEGSGEGSDGGQAGSASEGQSSSNDGEGSGGSGSAEGGEASGSSGGQSESGSRPSIVIVPRSSN